MSVAGFNSYLSIEEVLSEEDRLAVTFRVDVDKLGHLDPTSHQENLAKGSRIGNYELQISFLSDS